MLCFLQHLTSKYSRIATWRSSNDLLTALVLLDVEIPFYLELPFHLWCTVPTDVGPLRGLASQQTNANLIILRI